MAFAQRADIAAKGQAGAHVRIDDESDALLERGDIQLARQRSVDALRRAECRAIADGPLELAGNRLAGFGG